MTNNNLIDRLWKFVKDEALISYRDQDFKKLQETINGCLAEIPTTHRDKLTIATRMEVHK